MLFAFLGTGLTLPAMQQPKDAQQAYDNLDKLLREVSTVDQFSSVLRAFVTSHPLFNTVGKMLIERPVSPQHIVLLGSFVDKGLELHLTIEQIDALFNQAEYARGTTNKKYTAPQMQALMGAFQDVSAILATIFLCQNYKEDALLKKILTGYSLGTGTLTTRTTPFHRMFIAYKYFLKEHKKTQDIVLLQKQLAALYDSFAQSPKYTMPVYFNATANTVEPMLGETEYKSMLDAVLYFGQRILTISDEKERQQNLDRFGMFVSFWFNLACSGDPQLSNSLNQPMRRATPGYYPVTANNAFVYINSLKAIAKSELVNILFKQVVDGCINFNQKIGELLHNLKNKKDKEASSVLKELNSRINTKLFKVWLIGNCKDIVQKIPVPPQQQTGSWWNPWTWKIFGGSSSVDKKMSLLAALLFALKKIDKPLSAKTQKALKTFLTRLFAIAPELAAISADLNLAQMALYDNKGDVTSLFIAIMTDKSVDAAIRTMLFELFQANIKLFIEKSDVNATAVRKQQLMKLVDSKAAPIPATAALDAERLEAVRGVLKAFKTAEIPTESASSEIQKFAQALQALA